MAPVSLMSHARHSQKESGQGFLISSETRRDENDSSQHNRKRNQKINQRGGGGGREREREKEKYIMKFDTEWRERERGRDTSERHAVRVLTDGYSTRGRRMALSFSHHPLATLGLMLAQHSTAELGGWGAKMRKAGDPALKCGKRDPRPAPPLSFRLLIWNGHRARQPQRPHAPIPREGPSAGNPRKICGNTQYHLRR